MNFATWYNKGWVNMDNTDPFTDLLGVIDTLLGEGGCSWDKKQTHESLKPSILEESYEVIDAIGSNNKDYLCEELGDLLFLILLNCKISEKSGFFNHNDCLRNVKDKMVYRHPHVFLKSAALSDGEVLENWDLLKRKEKGYAGEADLIKNLPKALPALYKASKVSKRLVKNCPNDFNMGMLFEEFKNRWDSLKTSVFSGNSIDAENIGILFFILVTISAEYDINAEFALTNAIETYINKFGSYK